MSRLASALDGLMSMLETPGRRDARQQSEPAREITEQPLPTGQIPDPKREEFSATN